MHTYYYTVPNVDIVSKISILTDRINSDPQITTQTLNSINYTDPILSAEFSDPLLENEVYIVDKMVQAIFHGIIAGQNYHYNNSIVEPRNVFNINYEPINTDDIYGGFNVGSSIYNPTLEKIYTCVDSTPNNAIWLDKSSKSFCNMYYDDQNITITEDIGYTGYTGFTGSIIYSSPDFDITSNSSGIQYNGQVEKIFSVEFDGYGKIDPNNCLLGLSIDHNGHQVSANAEKYVDNTSTIYLKTTKIVKSLNNSDTVNLLFHKSDNLSDIDLNFTGVLSVIQL